MHPDLHEYLEGRLPADRLDEPEQERARAWDLLIDAAREPERPSPWLEGHVLRALTARQARPGWRRLLETRTISIRVRPVVIAVATAALAAVLLLWRRPGAPEVAPMAALTPAPAGPVMVQFTLEAPGARSVSVAGSFNNWAAGATPLQDVDGDGRWTALIPLGPGVHQYMFLVDDREWVADPGADRFVDDGFGRRNAIVAVSAPDERAL